MTMRIFRNTARFIMGAVFIFSGFVKAIDPWGSAYKFSDYFEAFGMDFLMPLSFAFALILSTTELTIGLNLFFRIRMKETAWVLIIYMVYFTILTFYSAITNPVTDCGCFGDALILTNWQTFFKNLIFLAPTILIFHQRKQYISGLPAWFEWFVTGLLASAVVLLSMYCIRNLPLIDFRPYKIGSNIPKLMEIPEGMPVDEYETVLVYEKDGIQREFTLESPEKPWSDSTWKWIETNNRLVKKGYIPPIHDFSLVSDSGVDATDNVLSDPGYSFLIVSYDVRKAKLPGMKKINQFAEGAAELGYKVYGMTSSTQEVILKTIEPMKLNFEFYTTDEITLKTMVRSNPGLVLIKEGVVIGKWHFRDIPVLQDFQFQGALSYALLTSGKKKSKDLTLNVVLLIGLLGLIMSFFRSKFQKSIT